MPADHALARKWFRRAAAQGHVRAQVNLAIQYCDGVGGSRNASEAFSWFAQAAKQGDTRATRMMGVLYAEGRGVPQALPLKEHVWCMSCLFKSTCGVCPL